MNSVAIGWFKEKLFPCNYINEYLLAHLHDLKYFSILIIFKEIGLYPLMWNKQKLQLYLKVYLRLMATKECVHTSKSHKTAALSHDTA